MYLTKFILHFNITNNECQNSELYYINVLSMTNTFLISHAYIRKITFIRVGLLSHINGELRY